MRIVQELFSPIVKDASFEAQRSRSREQNHDAVTMVLDNFVKAQQISQTVLPPMGLV